LLSEYIQNLSDAIAAMHSCRCSYFGSEKVIETFNGKEVWSGDVEIFQIDGHPKAKIAYGWAWKGGGDEIQYIGILKAPPVDSPVDAVRAAIASGQFS
jgi:hypothetical protein